VFLCDEPTSGIDAENREVVVDVLRQINREKQISLIFTTHDRAQASALTSRILVLEGGRLTATAYENVFTGVIEKHDAALHRFHIRNGLSIEVPKNEIEKQTGSSKIYLDPAGLKMTLFIKGRQPANTINATVISTAVENDHVRVVVDAGVSLTALLPAAEYREKRIMAGDTVQLTVPPESIHLI
jgi:tungstate transport system ATP-binding protein